MHSEKKTGTIGDMTQTIATIRPAEQSISKLVIAAIIHSGNVPW